MQASHSEPVDMVPLRVTIWVCAVCGRKEFTGIGWLTKHYSRGSRCEGKPEPHGYIYEGPR